MSSNSTKTRRITQACDFCHRRGLKCKEVNSTSTNSNPSCQTCLEFGEICTRNRKPKKRGSKRQVIPAPTANGQPSECDVSTSSTRLRMSDVVSPVNELSASGSTISRKIVTELLDVYLDTVHPMFPLFCERELWVGWRDGSFPTNASDYMNLVCMCALSALHANNRALFSDEEPSLDTSTLAQSYLCEAKTLVAKSTETAGPTQLIRSYGFLALVGAQSGNSIVLHKYLGLFHTISSRSNYHDESTWPSEISGCEREVRRRLWWAMYRLEVHTACMFGSLIRCSETQCDVGYPSGLHHPSFIPGRDGQFEDWFSGWNLTTDLYRLLEHSVLNLRFRHRKQSSILQSYYGPDISQIMERLSKLQDQIVPQFGSVASRSSDSGRNRCGFQACNILCTIHLARMMASVASHQGTQIACQAARDMMVNMSSIPHEYIRATGSPLLQQLAGVGYMLLSVARRDVAIYAHYSTLKEVMQLIVEFLTRFSMFSKLAAAAKEKLCAELADFEKQSHSSETYQAIETSMPDEGDIFGPAVYFDTFMFDRDAGGQDFLSANLLRSFVWGDSAADNS